MQVSERLIEFLKHWEGFRSKAYLDVGGVPTIGYGHTKNVKLGDTITKEQAERLLREEASQVGNEVARLLKVPVNQHQFDALVSFHYNTGALGRSTLLKKLNNKDIEGAACEFRRWVYVKGQKEENKGLMRRRAAEEKMFRGEKV